MRVFLPVAALVILFAATTFGADVYRNTPQGASLCSDSLRVQYRDATIEIGDHCMNASTGHLYSGIDRNNLFLVKDMRPMAERSGYRVLYGEGGWNLVEWTDPEQALCDKELYLRPVENDMRVTGGASTKDLSADPLITEFVGTLSEQSYQDALSMLSVDFSSRFSCHPDIANVQDEIISELEASGLTVETKSFAQNCFTCGTPDGGNIIGIKTGTTYPDEYVLLGAHYDSLSLTPCINAPGANDNGSGAAALIEIARAFAAYDTERSVIFAAFGGEELGLVGSEALASEYVNSGMLDKINGAVILDMIAYYDQDYAVMIEGSNALPAQQQAVGDAQSVTALYTGLSSNSSYNYWGSDHEPFLDRGVPCVLMIEDDWDDYGPYHTGQDTFDKQDIPYAIEMTKAAGSLVATWAGLLQKPIDDDDLTDDDDQTDDDDSDDDVIDDDDVTPDDDDNIVDDDDLLNDDDSVDDDDNDDSGLTGGDDDDDDGGCCG